MTVDLQGTTVAVINGNRGVGPGLVEAFHQAGADVRVAQTPHASSPAASDVPLLDNLTSVQAFLDTCDPLGVLVHVSHPVRRVDVLDETQDGFAASLEIDLVNPLRCLSQAAARMSRTGNGRIITFVSMSGKTGVHEKVALSASANAGLIAFSRSLAADLAPHGVTVNVVATALFEPAALDLPTERQRELVRGIPVGRFGKPEEAAHAALFLASPDAAFVTGETLNLSGGRFMD